MKQTGFLAASRLVTAAMFTMLMLSWVVPSAAQLPSGFQKEQIASQLAGPVAVQFSSDGRMFVAEKVGRILVFDSIADTTPELFADLRVNVYSRWDRGLMGMVLDPDFPSSPYIYLSYAFDGVVDQQANEEHGYAPKWGNVPPTDTDPCPDPPGVTSTPGGCVVAGRVSRIQADGNQMLPGSELVLVQDYFQQYPSHSIGGLAFGRDGYLYASGGDGASFSVVDHGQYGSDPPAGFPAEQFPDDGEFQGGAVRSQDLETAGDAVGLSGTVIRIDKSTGLPAPGNPLAGHSDLNARRVIAYGLRNPFSIATRPDTDEIWIADVGWGSYEEINRLADPVSDLPNFGWPCYSGTVRQSSYKNAGLPVCSELYALDDGQPSQAFRAHALPHYAYHHGTVVGPGQGVACSSVGTSSITGLAFYPGGSYPAAYDDALFFADYSRKCLYVLLDSDQDGVPDQPAGFEAGSSVVQMTLGPGGDVYYVDHREGTVQRIRYSDNQQPSAQITLQPGSSASGIAPHFVAFDASGSSDPDEDPLGYEWDLDGDGDFDDSTAEKPSRTYDVPETLTVGLRVTDIAGNSDTASLEIEVSNSAPTATIEAPLPTHRWQANEQVSFSGSATDLQDGDISGDDFLWELLLHHCDLAGQCHAHNLFEGMAGAGGVLQAPDHELPAWLELILTVTDSNGATDSVSVELQPLVGMLTMSSSPSGIELGVGSVAAESTPFQHAAVVGGTVSVIAPDTTQYAGTEYGFWNWSDGGARTHDLTVAGDLELTAEYRKTIDLALELALPPPVAVGEMLHYDIVVTNLGVNQASQPGVAVALPVKLEFVSASGQGWTCTSDELVLCNAGALEPQASTPELQLTFRALSVGDVFSTVKGLHGPEVDTDPANDTVVVLNSIIPQPPLFEDGFESSDFESWSRFFQDLF